MVPGAGKPAYGAIAQLGERRPCKAEVGGSIPPGSTIVVPVERLLIKFIVRVSGFGISERLVPGTWALIFNNLVVLSRASWVQDDSEHDRDDHAIY